MKIIAKASVKSVFALFIYLSVAGSAHALRVSGTFTSTAVSNAPVASKAYTFVCPTGTVQARMRVLDLPTIQNGAATVYATFGKDGSPTLTTLDTDSSTAWSPWMANTLDRNGAYLLVITKSGLGQEDFIAEVICLDSTLVNVIGPTTITLQVNQQ